MVLYFGCVQGGLGDLIVAVDYCVLSSCRNTSSEQNGKKETAEQNMTSNSEKASNTMLSSWSGLIVLGSPFWHSMMAASLLQSSQRLLCAPGFVHLPIQVYW